MDFDERQKEEPCMMHVEFEACDWKGKQNDEMKSSMKRTEAEVCIFKNFSWRSRKKLPPDLVTAQICI